MAPLPPALSELAETTAPALEALHPALWRAHQLARGREGALGSGFAELDAELPGGGWPHRALTELLLPRPGIGEIRLLAPALATLAGAQRPVMLFDPPARLSAWALVELGVDALQLIVVHGRAQTPPLLRGLPPAADVLWAAEHALRSGQVGALLLWLAEPLRADLLRRLQLAAQAHDGPAFLLRPLQARTRPSAAPLRLALHPAAPDLLSVQILKRRGPAAGRSIKLWLAPVLPPAAASVRAEPVEARMQGLSSTRSGPSGFQAQPERVGHAGP
jgi:protein ImuA